MSDASHERLNICRQNGCRHGFSGDLRNREKSSSVGKFDNVAVVAAAVARSLRRGIA
jgi:hypothetical protein